MPALELFLHDRFVGAVEPAPRDRTRVVLAVDPGHEGEGILLSEAFAVLAGRRAPTEAVSNFLGGYVPEGNHRAAMAAKRGIDSDDLFALLREFGGSIAGAVTLRRPDESALATPTIEPLDDRMLDQRLRQAIDDIDQGIPDDSRSTLPGYQPKLLVSRAGHGWALPHGRAHSTWILKPQVPARPTRIFDEHYAHLLGRHLGMLDYASELRTAGRTRYLAIERFDREVVDGEVRPHHQEDLAQALSLDWRRSDVKFQDARRPRDPKRATARRIGEVLGTIPAADSAARAWLARLTFQVAIGDNDAHAKNVALLHLPTGTRLAPLYDAVPNLFQVGLISHDLALAIDGQFDHRRISVERLVREAVSWGVISPSRAEAVVETIIGAVARAVDEVSAPRGLSDGLVDALRWNTRRLQSGSEISEPKR